MGFTIKELETLSGIKAHTIRIWEQRYHFLKPSRTVTNIRTYSNNELKELLTVALLHKYGYKISRIDKMPQEKREEEVLRLDAEEAVIELEVNKMVGDMVDLNIIGFEKLLNGYIKRFGLSHTITKLIFAFLEKVGILWHTSRIHPAHEHIVSNIIRQKIIAAIEALPHPPDNDSLHLLFLPEEAHHELGLLFVHYLLKQNNIPVLYLGSNVPLNDVHYIVDQMKPKFLYTHLTSIPHKLNFVKYFTELSKGSYDYEIKISGSVTESYSKKSFPTNITFLKTLSETFAYINNQGNN